MQISAGRLTGAMYALLAAAMAMPSGLRNVAQLLILVILALMMIFILSDDRWRKLNRNAGLLLMIMFMISIGSLMNIVAFGMGLRPAIMQILPPVTTLATLFGLQYLNLQNFFRSYARTCLYLFLISFALFVAGVQIFNNANAYGLVVVPAVVYLAHLKKNRRQAWMLAVAGMVVSNYVEARLALAMILLAVLTCYMPSRVPFYKAVGVVAVAIVIAANIYLTFNFDFVLNELLTNRVTLWNAFGQEIRERPWQGYGYISEGTVDSVVEYVKLNVGRAVNDRYATQSMYLLYLYQTGIPGLIGIIAMIALSLRSAERFFWPLVITLIAASTESVYVGSPSIIGTPLLIFMLSGLLEKHQVRFRNAAAPLQQPTPSV